MKVVLTDGVDILDVDEVTEAGLKTANHTMRSLTAESLKWISLDEFCKTCDGTALGMKDTCVDCPKRK